MYRFLISRKTVFAMASLWLVTGLLLFVAGWLLGRHQAAPTVNADRLAAVLSHSTAAAPSTTSAAAAARHPRPWQKASPPTTAPTPTATGVTTAPDPETSTPSAAPDPAPATSLQPTTPQASTTTAAPAAPSSTPDVTATAAKGTAAKDTASKDTADATNGGLYSLQIGAFASEANAQVQIDKVTPLGLAPFVVPVVDGARTLYTVRLGRYSSREAAQAAAAELRESSGLAAVIRDLPIGS
ncbi:MAG: SPOR domain-containing protein [Acidobacteriota bacterium]